MYRVTRFVIGVVIAAPGSARRNAEEVEERVKKKDQGTQMHGLALHMQASTTCMRLPDKYCRIANEET